MANLTLCVDTPSQRSPATAPLSAPATDTVASYTDKDLYTDFTDATDIFKGLIPGRTSCAYNQGDRRIALRGITFIIYLLH